MLEPRTSASTLVRELRLDPHPEGGYYREVHRSTFTLGVPPGFPSERVASTAILFLLAEADFSAFHRVRGEELWIHLAGADLELVTLADPAVRRVLGRPGFGGELLAAVAPGTYQAARALGSWSLTSCVVAPGFEFADFEMPARAELLHRFPHAEALIRTFTRR